jgi:hypothetical protein
VSQIEVTDSSFLELVRMLATRFGLSLIFPVRRNCSSVVQHRMITSNVTSFAPQNKCCYAKEFTHRPPKAKPAAKEAARPMPKSGTVSEGSLKFESLGVDPKNPQTILATAIRVCNITFLFLRNRLLTYGVQIARHSKPL